MSFYGIVGLVLSGVYLTGCLVIAIRWILHEFAEQDREMDYYKRERRRYAALRNQDRPE